MARITEVQVRGWLRVHAVLLAECGQNASSDLLAVEKVGEVDALKDLRRPQSGGRDGSRIGRLGMVAPHG